MKLGEKKAALLTITESIEMELFSSEEPCIVISTLEKEEEHNSHQRHLEHPLVPDWEEEPEPEVQTQPKQQPKPKSEPHAGEETEHCASVPSFMEEIDIEMEVLPPFQMCRGKLVERKSDDSSIMTTSLAHKSSRLRWKRLTPQQAGLVVKDVVCLPRGCYLAQLERHILPQSKHQVALAAMGMAARITVDYSWSANQMEGRMEMLFSGHFVKQAGQKFTFTYLQCVQGSRALFIPDTPTEGWTGEQVLRISGHGPVYIFSHQDYPQGKSERSSACEMPVINGSEFCLEASTESCKDEDNHGSQMQPGVCRTTEDFTLELNTVLRLFRQKNTDECVEIQIQVRRRDLLHSALKVVRRPGFCFRTTPIISFSGEETASGSEASLREFFRLALHELQQSSVFEGQPGRLFLTYDLTAFENRKYYEAGVLIGWSLAQGGPGPRCLHPALYQLMCGHNPAFEDLSWTDIADAEVQNRLQQLQSCTDVKRLPSSLCDWILSCGVPGIYSAPSDAIAAIYIYVVKHYIYHRVASMISQFTEGLNSCGGLWDVIRSHREAFLPVMTSAGQQPLTLEEFKQLFTVCYSHRDSQLRAAEEITAGHWETVLTFISNGQADFSFEDILAFITGADQLPPLGFSRLISVCFYSQDCLPYASTCALELFLPRAVAGAMDLLALLTRAVHEALGFTRFNIQGLADNRSTEVVTS